MTGWNANEEKLLSLIAIDDSLALRLSPEASDAFFRAFVVEDRKTGKVECRYRMKYRNGQRNWYSFKLKEDVPKDAAVDKFEEAIKKMMSIAAGVFDVPDTAVVKCFRPPDDAGDPDATLQWLVDRDLVEVKWAEGWVGDLIKPGGYVN